MINYKITKHTYTTDDVDNALSLNTASVKFESIIDGQIYENLQRDIGLAIVDRILKIHDDNIDNLIKLKNDRRLTVDEEEKSKITFLIRCIISGKKFKKNNAKYINQFNEQYKRIFAQIFQSYKLNRMLWVSRSNNTYVKIEICRYFGYIYNTDLLCLIFDIMEELGYIDGIGFEKGNKYKVGKSSRYIPNSICTIFDKITGKCNFVIEKCKEVIILKDDFVKYKRKKIKNGKYIYVKKIKKKLKRYTDSEFTNERRAFIEKLNAFYSLKKVEIKANNILLKYSIIPKIYQLIMNNRIRLDKFVFEKIDDENKCKLAVNNLINDKDNAKDFDISNSTESLNEKHILCQQMATEKNLDYQKVYDGHVFIKELKFEILDKSVRSIFSRGSFDYGGRFYGSVTTELPKILRKCLFIDDEPVLSGDFKAFHIYLAYHLAGKPCPMADPYDLPGTSRDEMKLASLVAINAPDLDSAVFGTMYKINTSLSEYNADSKQITEKRAECLITTFIENHPLLLDKVASDYGVTLQNRDSIIMQDALDTLMGEGICGFSVHDEIIVPAKHIDRAVEIMIQAYKKQPFTNGFEPIVEVDRKWSRMPRMGHSSGSNYSMIGVVKHADDGLNKAA